MIHGLHTYVQQCLAYCDVVHTVCRVSALRILCDLRLEKEDLHNVVENAIHPPKKSKSEKRAIEKAKQNGQRLPPEEPMPSLDDMRREPTAKDSSGLLYWYLDYHTTTGAFSFLR